MENNITAEEFIEQRFSSIPTELEDIKDLMVEFAKLHVQAALKAASKKVEIHSDSGSYYYREFEEGIRNKTIWVPANSIINAYDLNNIK